MRIEVKEDIVLELTAPQHAAELFGVVDANRPHLSRFLPWVEHMRSVADFERYISQCEELYRQGKEQSFVIRWKQQLVGRIGLHYINLSNKSAAIGYWLSGAAEGHGIITSCCTQLLDHGFHGMGLQRIELKAAVENTRSQAIAERLHFTREGLLRQAEWVNHQFMDLYIYSMLKEEWKAFSSPAPANQR